MTDYSIAMALTVCFEWWPVWLNFIGYSWGDTRYTFEVRRVRVDITRRSYARLNVVQRFFLGATYRDLLYNNMLQGHRRKPAHNIPASCVSSLTTVNLAVCQT